MKIVCLCLLAALSLANAHAQSARQLTKRIAPLTTPPAPRAVPGTGGAAAAAGVAPSAPANPAVVAAQKSQTDKNLIDYQKKRAEAGSDNAQYELGLRYLTGNGVELDEKLGREWLAKSAKNGNLQAAKKLKELKPLDNPPAEPAKAPTPAAKPAAASLSNPPAPK